MAFYLAVFFLFLIALAVSWAACGFVRTQLLKAVIMDAPNERSLHKVPVPRGGGLGLWLAGGIILAALLGLMLLATGNWPEVDRADRLFPFLAVLALILVSWLDDKRSLSPVLRLGVHILAVTLGLLSLPEDKLILGGALPFWLERFLLGFGWLWFINLYNFMDGIDGITGAESLHICAGVLAVYFFLQSGVDGFGNFHTDPPLVDPLVSHALPLAGLVAGFLLWNWHPAKLFLGDVGSIPLGYIFGLFLIHLALVGYVGIALTLPLYYLADATITLLRRMSDRKKFWQAHREHFYQKAALAVGRHDAVVWPIIATNLALFGLSVASLYAGTPVLFVAPLPVALLLWYLSRLSRKAA